MPIYSIAGIKTEMNPAYSLLTSRAEPYLTEGCDADISIEVKPESIERLIKRFHRPQSAPQFEYTLAGTDFYNKLLNFNGMVLHSSGVVVDGRAYLFSANSGTGKSTHTALWLELLGEKAFIINDDKPAVCIRDSIAYAYGTPFSGKTALNVNTKAPIAGICFIERSNENHISRLSVREAVPLMLAQTQRRRDKSHMDKLLKFMDELLRIVPVYKLCCNTDISSARMSYDMMREGTI